MTPRPLAWVTGASRGVGRAIALALADAGYDLILSARAPSDGLDETLRLATARGAAGRTVTFDLADAAGIDAAVRGLGSDRTRFAVLVNNAANAGERTPLADARLEMIDAVLDANLRGALLMCRAALPLLEARGGGSIVNISAQAASFGGRGLAVYSASKAALNGLTVALAREAAPLKVRINAVSPGPVLTDAILTLPEARRDEMQAELPLGRFCEPDEVAKVVAWLVSDQASYVSGAIVPVHGAR